MEVVTSREVEIEVTLAFPELDGESGDHNAVAEVFRAMSAAGPGEPLKARIRLEATWTYGASDDDISSKIYWITSLDTVPFGERDIAKLPFNNADRRRIEMRYLPATRDGNAILKLALRELLAWLEKFGDWSGGRDPMAKQWDALQSMFDGMPAISKVTSELALTWNRLFDGPHLKTPRLTVLAREIQRALRELSLTLGQGPGGRHRPVQDLSEGQASLFYVALVVTLFKLDGELVKAKIEGFREIEAVRPWLTIFALEEPENHLAPFYLSRMINLLKEQAQTEAVMAVVTTHSASALRRVTPQQVRYVRHDAKTLVSKVREIQLPPKTADAYKFIQEAVTSHPELYFARLVILGEGRSEEVVLPRIARALHADLELDPAFVAFVPLGGRHVNHFWRLLKALEIPYVTLLDFDLGRHGGGARRLRYAVEQLRSLGDSDVPPPADLSAWDSCSPTDIAGWITWLRNKNLFYSAELDLDMSMLQAFPGAYGPIADVDPTKLVAGSSIKSVFGKDGIGPAAYATPPDELQQAQYCALFKGGSKPVSHVAALAELDDATIKAAAPEPLRALFARCRTMLDVPPTLEDLL
jgi:putative ATP-dependent endonuclease of OLD family